MTKYVTALVVGLLMFVAVGGIVGMSTGSPVALLVFIAAMAGILWAFWAHNRREKAQAKAAEESARQRMVELRTYAGSKPFEVWIAVRSRYFIAFMLLLLGAFNFGLGYLGDFLVVSAIGMMFFLLAWLVFRETFLVYQHARELWTTATGLSHDWHPNMSDQYNEALKEFHETIKDEETTVADHGMTLY